jgi:MFS family permease
MLRHLLAGFFALSSIPVCAAVAAAAVASADHLLGEMVPASCGKRGLALGLIGMWGVVLFGFLLGQVERVADRIVGATASGLDAQRRPGRGGGRATDLQ